MGLLPSRATQHFRKEGNSLSRDLLNILSFSIWKINISAYYVNYYMPGAMLNTSPVMWVWLAMPILWMRELRPGGGFQSTNSAECGLFILSQWQRVSGLTLLPNTVKNLVTQLSVSLEAVKSWRLKGIAQPPWKRAQEPREGSRAKKLLWARRHLLSWESNRRRWRCHGAQGQKGKP